MEPATNGPSNSQREMAWRCDQVAKGTEENGAKCVLRDLSQE